MICQYQLCITDTVLYMTGGRVSPVLAIITMCFVIYCLTLHYRSQKRVRVSLIKRNKSGSQVLPLQNNHIVITIRFMYLYVTILECSPIIDRLNVQWVCSFDYCNRTDERSSIDPSKAPSTPATMSKQHCRMLQVERFFRQSRNKLEPVRCSICFDFVVERTKFRSTLLPFLTTKSNAVSTSLVCMDGA